MHDWLFKEDPLHDMLSDSVSKAMLSVVEVADSHFVRKYSSDLQGTAVGLIWQQAQAQAQAQALGESWAA